jgi:hypothetical protein
VLANIPKGTSSGPNKDKSSPNTSKQPGNTALNSVIGEYRTDDKDEPDEAAIIIPGKGIPKAKEKLEAEPEMPGEFYNQTANTERRLNTDAKSDNEMENEKQKYEKLSSLQKERDAPRLVAAFVEDKAAKDFTFKKKLEAQMSSSNSVSIPAGPFEKTKIIIISSEDSNAEDLGSNKDKLPPDMQSEEVGETLGKGKKTKKQAKKGGIRKQMFELADNSKAQRNRKLKKQLHKEDFNSNQGKECYSSRDQDDSEIIDGSAVQFKDNLYLSEGENFSDKEDMIYYPKEDMTNYSKRMGLNRVKAKVNEGFHSDQDIFDQIRPAMLSAGKYSDSQSESEPEEKLGQIMEDIKSENEISMKIRDKNVTSKRPSKQLQGRIKHDKKRRSYKPKTRSISPHGKMEPVDYPSPYNELLYKRYKEYHPEDIVC